MAEKVVIYYNPSCSKCQYALDYLQARGIQPRLIEYLENFPSKEDLKKILSALGLSPLDIIRKSEPVFLENFSGKNFSDEEWLDILVKNPILLQRPILVKSSQAIIVRDDESLARAVIE